MAFSNVEEAYSGLANYLVAFIGSRSWDMATVAERILGKPKAQNIQTIFLQKPDGSIVRFNRSK